MDGYLHMPWYMQVEAVAAVCVEAEGMTGKLGDTLHQLTVRVLYASDDVIIRRFGRFILRV